MSKVIKGIIVAVVLLAAIGGGAWYYLSPDEVSAVRAGRRDVVPSISLVGNVEGNEPVTVYAPVSGTIEAKNVNVGQRVHKGDVLLSYATEKQENAIDIARITLDYDQQIVDAINKSRSENKAKVAKANQMISQCEVVYATLKLNIMALDSGTYSKDYDRKAKTQIIENDIQKMENEVSEKQSELAKIEADLKKAELTEDKTNVGKLTEEAKSIQDKISETNEAISRSRRDIICLPIEGMDPATYDQYQSLQNDLETVTRLWSDARTERDTAQSMVKAYDELLGNEKNAALDELTLDEALKELEKASGGSVAPSDGIIIKCYVDTGASVEKGNPVIEMQKADSYMVKLLVSKYDITSIKEGQYAEIRIGNAEYKGAVSNISQYAQTDSSGKAKAEVSVDIYTEDPLIVGMEADVTIKLENISDTLTVPNECVYVDDSGSYVFTTDENHVVRRRYIAAGVKDATYTEVISGLNESDIIVSDPAAPDYEGEKVEEDML